MTYKTWIFLALFCSLLGPKMAALPLENLLSDNLVRQLLQSGAVSNERIDAVNLELVPRYASLERLLEENRRSLNPNVMIESLRLYRKPGTAANWTAAERTGLYNGIVALSTLSGLEYFSRTRNSMRVFYELSTVIDGPDSRNPRPDPVFRTPPAEMSIYARQKDLTFGDNVYKYTYYSDESSFIVLMENITNMTYGPVTVMDRNKLRSVIAIIDCGPYLLVYTASMARAVMLPGIRQRVGESVSNRATALLSWFTQKADQAFRRSS